MRLEAEFTTEPFQGEGDPPPHAVRAHDIAVSAGLATDFGPLGTVVRGDRPVVVGALRDILDAALDAGATRITLRIEVSDGDDRVPAEDRV